MSIGLTSNFFRLLIHFRRHDLVSFEAEHERLFKEAKRSRDHLAVTTHYYSVMSGVINEYFNGNFHFVPPSSDDERLDEALFSLNHRIGNCLNLKKGKKCVDIGCGIGGAMEDMADYGAEMIGITIAANDAKTGNERFERKGISNCRIIVADCHTIPLDNNTVNAVYAVYALKYFPDLKPVLREVNRILKPGGLFLVYDLLKTGKYDETSKHHRAILSGLEYACGMPPLHRRDEMLSNAEESGFEVASTLDLSKETGNPFYYCFSNSRLFMWLIRSSFVNFLISTSEAIGFLPKGFSRFNDIFLAGTVSKIVEGGQLGIISGSELLIFRKK
ncbi:hypothetical protein AB6A40_003491 [Gnathostoma spinigerum]|uniref:SAM-dependent methyltransferase Erg6/SMT-type domain-containing protein n=1 Tax=Gnathostoma spinigerum TaxID=75299 RepID=A0ABD6EBY9_9BILA